MSPNKTMTLYIRNNYLQNSQHDFLLQQQKAIIQHNLIIKTEMSCPQNCCVLSLATHSSTLTVEAANTFETSAPMYQTIRHHIPEGIFTFNGAKNLTCNVNLTW